VVVQKRLIVMIIRTLTVLLQFNVSKQDCAFNSATEVLYSSV